MMKFVRPLKCFLLSSMLLLPALVFAEDCGQLKNNFGPFDYRTVKDYWSTTPGERGYNRNLVEKEHFTPNIENLIKGRSGTLAQEIDYTLRAFPNHHRALYSISRLDIERPNPPKQKALIRSVNCYFERAMTFQPDDGVVRYLFAVYLHKKGKLKESLARYEEAKTFIPDNVEMDYNLGLLHVDLKNYKDAMALAKEVYAKGFPLPGLKNKLQRKGYFLNTKKTTAKNKDSGVSAVKVK